MGATPFRSIRSLGHVLIIRFFTRLTTQKGFLVLIALCLLHNPILLPSVFLMKLEGLVYLSSCILFILTYTYIVQGKRTRAFWVYFVGLFAMAIRVELLVFPLICFLHDHQTLFIYFFPQKTFLAPLRGGVLGLVSAFLLTLYPLYFWHRNFSSQPKVELEGKIAYGEKILSKISHNLVQPGFIAATWDTLCYYLDVLFWVLGPILLGTFLVSLLRPQRHLYFGLHVGILLSIICLFGHSYVHYALSLSLLIELLAYIWVIQSSWKFAHWILALHLLWVGSLSIGYLYTLGKHPPPLLKTHHYVLANSEVEELLAVETLSGAAAHPHIPECELEERIQLAQKLSPFGGTKYKLTLEQGENEPCRRQVDICEVNYLSAHPGESNDFVNTYDIAHLDSIRPAWYISTSPILPISEGRGERGIPSSSTNRQNSFYQHMLQHYEIDTIFHKNAHFYDSRVRKINIRETFYVCRRKNY